MPIRFSFEMLEKMDGAAKELGLENRSALVKAAVQALLRYMKEEGPDGMRIDYRLVFQQLVGEMDGRRITLAKVAESRGRYRVKKNAKSEAVS